jgi:hypothetical protein
MTNCNVITLYETVAAVHSLQTNENEGVCGLSFDFFSLMRLSVYSPCSIDNSKVISRFYTVSVDNYSTTIPMPKGHNADKSSSCNSRAISLSSVIAD